MILSLAHVAPTTTSDTLKQHFSLFGPVNKVKLIKQRNSNFNKGIAFVDFADIESCTKAVEAKHQVSI